MLILSRHVDDEIQIGDSITVRVTAIHKLDGRRPVVKLGIDAPQSVQIKRGELLEDRDDGEREDTSRA